MGATNKSKGGVKHSSALLFIVIVNALFFVGLRLIAAILNLGLNYDFEREILHQIELPASYTIVISKPWTALTYMFCQFDAWHLILNMLMLCLTGYYFTLAAGSIRFILLYLSGGIAGAAAFVCFSTYLPEISSAEFLTGSSAAVFSVMTATAVLMPKKKINLALFGEVKLKWIIIGIIALDLYLGATGENLGGHIAHAGGAVAGLIYSSIMNLFIKKERCSSVKSRKIKTEKSLNPTLTRLNQIK